MFVYEKAPLVYTIKDLISMTRSGVSCIEIDHSIDIEELIAALYGDDKEIFRYELVVMNDKMYLEHI